MEATLKQPVKSAEIAPIMDTKKQNGNVLMEIQIPRNLERGLEIHLKSSINWSNLLGHKAADKQPEKVMEIGRVVCYQPKNDRLDGVNGLFAKQSVHEHEEYPNLMLLLAKDLHKGVVFNFGSFPVSEQKLKEWIIKFREQIKVIYLTYFKPLNISVVISSQTVEVEEHD